MDTGPRQGVVKPSSGITKGALLHRFYSKRLQGEIHTNCALAGLSRREIWWHPRIYLHHVLQHWCKIANPMDAISVLMDSWPKCCQISSIKNAEEGPKTKLWWTSKTFFIRWPFTWAYHQSHRYLLIVIATDCCFDLVLFIVNAGSVRYNVKNIWVYCCSDWFFVSAARNGSDIGVDDGLNPLLCFKKLRFSSLISIFKRPIVLR